jgi:hypothetical protein
MPGGVTRPILEQHNMPAGSVPYLFTSGTKFALLLSAAAAAAAAAEVGHNMGLIHDGTTANVTYYTGQGNWAPVSTTDAVRCYIVSSAATSACAQGVISGMSNDYC